MTTDDIENYFGSIEKVAAFLCLKCERQYGKRASSREYQLFTLLAF